LDGGFQCLAGAGLGRAQPGFEFAGDEFDGIKIGRIGRQIQQAGTPYGDDFGQPDHFVGGQVVEHDHVARHQGGAEHMVQIGVLVANGRIYTLRPLSKRVALKRL
jgi:hypothetical protein